MRVEEQYADVLLHIETAIVTVYESTPDLLDRDVLAAIDALIRSYDKEKRSRTGVTPSPSGRARSVHERCFRVCEWQLGRESLGAGALASDDPEPGDLSVRELIQCLKRLRSNAGASSSGSGNRSACGTSRVGGRDISTTSVISSPSHAPGHPFDPS